MIASIIERKSADFKVKIEKVCYNGCVTAPQWRDIGLTAAEAMDRLAKVGPNELAQKNDYSSVKLVAAQFKSPLIYILLLAGTVTFFLKDYSDTLVILAAVGLNTALGFFQENKAQRALAALSGYLSPRAKVVRDGKRQEIEAREVVPGDVVVLGIGDRIPADGVIIEADSLSINEAMLTGESVPVGKEAIKGENFHLPLTSFQLETKWETGKWKIDKLHEVFMGTTVTTGIGRMVVTVTGGRTKMGEIGASLGKMKEEETPLQKQLDRLAGSLAVLVGAVSLIIFFGGALRGFGLLEVFTTSVAVAVAAIPEGLVVSLTVILALGMQKIFRQKALVRRLVAAETLGSVTVICSDKTGTLTEGKMKVVKAVNSLDDKIQRTQPSLKLWPAGKDPKNQNKLQTSNIKLQALIKAAVLCNDMRDPLEVGMLGWAEDQIGKFQINSKFQIPKTKQVIESIKTTYPRLDEIPFGPEHKYIATLHGVSREGEVSRVPRGETGGPVDIAQGKQESEKEKIKTSEVEGALTSEVEEGERAIFLSGAPEIILGKCKVKSEETKEWEQKFERLGSQGYRIVGFAYKRVLREERVPRAPRGEKLKEGDLINMTWLGVLVYEDPVRESVKSALAACRRAGIRVKVITGDYASTAEAVLNKLEIKNEKLKTNEVLTGDELEKMTDDELTMRVEDIILFARTSPQQKLRIVKALQARGEVVAMTGDGVNDAPAVKAADIGIVVAEASDVSKETADMVLLDSNFGTIVSAVEGGRLIFENIRKVVFYLLSDSFMEVALVAGSLVLGLPLPVTAAQILWINLAEDALPGMSLAFETECDNLMAEPPHSRDNAILNQRLGRAVVGVGVVTSMILLGLFYSFTQGLVVVSHPQTVIFVALGAISLFNVFAARSMRGPLWRHKFWNNRRLNLAVVVGLGLLALAVYLPPLRRLLDTQPLDLSEWLLLVFLGGVNLVVVERIKKAFLWSKK